MSEKGWMFSEAPGAIPDSVNHAQYLQKIYLKADPKYTGQVTVPVLWDKRSSTIVNNESREIIRMFDVEFAPLATQKIDLYPRDLQQKIDETIDAIYLPINAGVYRSGLATEQAAYEDVITELFESLDQWETVLSKQRYLCGAQLTEADICMFTTLYRFDSVYHGHFKCNLRRILDYPNLWNYVKDLYQYPEFKATCNLDTHIFLWFISGDSRLSTDVRDFIRDSDNEIYLSVVSVWESIVKYQLGKLPLPESPEIYLPKQRDIHQIVSLDLDESSVAQLAKLPPLHRDPFDRRLCCKNWWWFGIISNYTYCSAPPSPRS